jgi:DNA-binding response OmpR family regulator
MSDNHPVKIIMIEDDLGHAKLIEKNIRRANINNEIKHFTDGSSAFGYLFSDEVRANGPLLLLLDLNLPDVQGTEILSRVKADEHLKRMPVVILTTTDDKIEIERCYDLGCNVYITKPVDYESFAGAIRQLGLFLSVIQVPETE